jgi:uncharacterized membrane protein
MSPEHSARSAPTAWKFNKEIILGEIGSLLGAYAAAWIATRLTRSSALISAALIPGTLLGGTVFWLTARISHMRERRNWSVGVLARDITYFTPVAAVLGFAVYDPAIFFASRFLLVRGAGVVLSVAGGQITAFSLFLASMNAYRLVLARTGMRHL